MGRTPPLLAGLAALVAALAAVAAFVRFAPVPSRSEGVTRPPAVDLPHREVGSLRPR